MSELSPTTRALLDAAREGLAPDASALRRVRGKVDAAVAVGGSAIAAKLAIVVIATAAIVGGAVAVRHHDAAIAPALAFEPSPPPAMAREERVHEMPPPPAPPAEIEMPPVRARTARPIVVAAQAAIGIDLAREVELVDAAMAALRRGDPTAALASVRIHREETRNAGQLAEDAAAIEIEALCRLRDRRVAPKLEAFDARWPESAQRSRLTTNCP